MGEIEDTVNCTLANEDKPCRNVLKSMGGQLTVSSFVPSYIGAEYWIGNT